MTWVMEGLDGGLVTSSLGFEEDSGKTSQTVSHSFSTLVAMCFWSAWKGIWLRCLPTNVLKCRRI